MNAPVDLDHRSLAYSMPLDKFDVSDPRLYYDDVWQPYFERLRREDPVHYTPESPYGPYWAVTKYRDIVQVEVNHKVFSSSDEVGGIQINDAPKGMERTSFIRMDPPEHDEQRREVSSTVNPITLAKMESLIRERTNMVLDGLPRGETFDWVERVSIELTSMMLATLFDYPIDQKSKLIRWSDTFICDINAPDAPVHSEEERFAEQMRFAEHMNEIWEDRAKKPKSFDVISILAHGEATSKMTLRQRMGILILFLVGGNDTTRNSMSGGAAGPQPIPEQFAKLRANPELVTSAVSEIVAGRHRCPHAPHRDGGRRDRRQAHQGRRQGGGASPATATRSTSNARTNSSSIAAPARAHVVRLRHPPLPRQPPGRIAAARPVGGDPATRPADRGHG